MVLGKLDDDLQSSKSNQEKLHTHTYKFLSKFMQKNTFQHSERRLRLYIFFKNKISYY